jgi:hypothetical protein
MKVVTCDLGIMETIMVILLSLIAMWLVTKFW